ncbi:hypothetical protein [Rossellomorea sp. KS-H15a]|uniref:hypothetical protein n=1 Tax=Rossellomorea sp. KS-H15a TaxID=2963940 RepID=UPI0020C6F1D0|nr:hypothetical protein [Rossellomorea sp. KS-H15a]UTE78880.1 hypothetical protein M1J35_09055 [Rossellomorea sp. KS-H15a]
MEIAAILFVVVTLPLIIGTGRKFKLYTGGIVIGTALLFLIGELIIKVQSDYFSLGRQEWFNHGFAEDMGKWVVPFFLLGVAIFLILVNIRMIQQFLKRKDGIRWVWIAFVVVIDVFALFLVPMLLFFVAFMFFPFAP